MMKIIMAMGMEKGIFDQCLKGVFCFLLSLSVLI